MIRHNVVGIGTALRAGRSAIRIPVREKNSLLQNDQTGTGAQLTTYSVVTGFFLVVKRPDREIKHSPPPSVEVKNEWSYTSAPPVCLHSMYKEKLTFTLLPFCPGVDGLGGWFVLRIGLLM